jgi:hypothetical protein
VQQTGSGRLVALTAAKGRGEQGDLQLLYGSIEVISGVWE